VAPDGQSRQCREVAKSDIRAIEERRQILVVEDNDLLSMLMEEMLDHLGYGVIGPAASVQEALGLLKTVSQIDGALLDFLLIGEKSLSIADALLAKNVPFAFVTGYGAGAAETSSHVEAPVLEKPFNMTALSELLNRILPTPAI
jgi:CheY-like chemotaxis protein